MALTLTNDTTLRGYLATLQSNVRTLAKLHGERLLAGATKPWDMGTTVGMETHWEKLRTDLAKVLPDCRLVSFATLAHSRFPTGDVDPGHFGKDPTRVRFGVLKKMADKARCKDPSITLLGSWDLDARQPEETI